ncbi:ABC transporter permease [Paenibacillus sp. GCM10012307]|uniref:ABC-2 family transporter protein n=1 Tax=Paenibacillus roseus TaxID=2798579 RepID=A0A934J8A1_9BACL|nr:ABC-2 family transporter protein [Paenibacillus roseus]MBJ6362257.1 ABC-2 family transporter protein [Paenibacillus roseus]
MRMYWSVFKLRLYNGLQYRSAALAGIVTQFFWGFIAIMVFEAFYSQALSQPPMSLPELISYIWLKQAFLILVILWLRDSELSDLITSGNIAYDLCRPSGIYNFWYAKLLAQRLSGAALRCSPILIISFFLPHPYRLMSPPDSFAFWLFIISLLLGLLLVTAISMLIYISVFATLSPSGSFLMFAVLGEFLSGMIVPIPLLPQWLQQILYALPFHFTADFPFRVYSGHIPASEALVGIGIQMIWLAVLFVVGKWLMSRALRNIVVQGG